MSGFEDRGKGFEAKFQADQEAEFKIVARRNKLLGEWAAREMGLADADVAPYAQTVVMADFEKPGDDDVLAKVLKDFQDKGIAHDERQIRKKMSELMAVAAEQLK